MGADLKIIWFNYVNNRKNTVDVVLSDKIGSRFGVAPGAAIKLGCVSKGVKSEPVLVISDDGETVEFSVKDADGWISRVLESQGMERSPLWDEELDG